MFLGLIWREDVCTHGTGDPLHLLVGWGEADMGVGKEEMGRTAAGFAWQVWLPLSSVSMIKFPKWFWPAHGRMKSL